MRVTAAFKRLLRLPGASGVTLGGGLGWLSGLHGASCDNLLSARVVTADARVLAAIPASSASSCSFSRSIRIASAVS